MTTSVFRRILFLAPALLATGAVAPPAPGGTVRVAIEGLRSSRGMVRACMTAVPADFPDCRKDPAARKLSIPAAPGDMLVFNHVAPGRYAISVLHDENDNGRMDKVLMIPKEGFGFSRDAPVHMTPPSFAAAAFDVGAGVTSTAIRIRYMM